MAQYDRNRRGWMITAQHEMPDPWMRLGTSPVFQSPRYVLSDLQVTVQEANALMELANARGSRPVSFRYAPGYRGDFLIASDIEITAAQAEALHRGADPVDVLLGNNNPRLVLRSLSVAELMGR
jgi:hypothetical protein